MGRSVQSKRNRKNKKRQKKKKKSSAPDFSSFSSFVATSDVHDPEYVLGISGYMKMTATKQVHEAIVDFKESIALYEAKNKKDLLDSKQYGNLCKIYGHTQTAFMMLHNNEEALKFSLIWEERSLKRVKGEKFHKEMGIIYDRTSQICKKLKKFELAIEYAKKHLAVLGDENHKEASGIYHTIADIYRVAKMDGKAIMYYEKCINTPGAPQKLIGSAYNNMGTVYLNQGIGLPDGGSEAKAALKLATDYFSKAIIYIGNAAGSKKDEEHISQTYTNMGTAYLLNGQHRKALTCVKKCIEINVNLFGLNHPKTLKAQETLTFVESLDPETCLPAKKEKDHFSFRAHCNSKCSGCSKEFDSNHHRYRCGKCKSAYYCSSKCQAKDWKLKHKKECKKLRLEKEETKHLNKAIKKFAGLEIKKVNEIKKKSKDEYTFGEIFPDLTQKILSGEMWDTYRQTALGCIPMGSALIDNIPPITLETPPMLTCSRSTIIGEEATLAGLGNAFLTVHKDMMFVAELKRIPAEAAPFSSYKQLRGQHGGVFIRIQEKFTDDNARYKLLRAQVFQLYIMGEVVFTPDCFKAAKKTFYDDGGCIGAHFEWPDHRCIFMCPVTRRIATPDSKTPYIFCYQPLAAIYWKDGIQNTSTRLMPRLLSMEGYNHIMQNKRNHCNSEIKIPTRINLNQKLECFPDAQNYLEQYHQAWIPNYKTQIDFNMKFTREEGVKFTENNGNELMDKYIKMVRKRGDDPAKPCTVIPTFDDMFNYAENTQCRICLERFTSGEYGVMFSSGMKAITKDKDISIIGRKERGALPHENPLTDITNANEKCPCGSGNKYKKCCGERTIKLQKKRVKEINFPMDLEVTFCKLKTKALNGVYGTVVKEYDEKTGRIGCKRQDTGKVLALKPENLVTKYVHKQKSTEEEFKPSKFIEITYDDTGTQEVSPI